MELYFLFPPIHFGFKDRWDRLGRLFSKNKILFRGENGEAVINLALSLLISSSLFLSLIWLNQYFHTKTKDHLNAFRKDWNTLEKKYQE